MILFLCAATILFQISSCFIINDINLKMLSNSKSVQNVTHQILTASLLRSMGFAYPGTKWCGPDNVADNYEDLGVERETDMCCREHDYCPESINGGDTKNNITNTAFYTRLSCNCDNQFHYCLKSANTLTATLIANLYFNAMQTQCFKLEYPTVSCMKRGGWFNKKCVRYRYDRTKDKRYQWFDVPDF